MTAFLALDLCPYCGSDDITDVINYLTPEEEQTGDILRCLDCQNTWTVEPPAGPDLNLPNFEDASTADLKER